MAEEINVDELVPRVCPETESDDFIELENDNDVAVAMIEASNDVEVEFEATEGATVGSEEVLTKLEAISEALERPADSATVPFEDTDGTEDAKTVEVDDALDESADSASVDITEAGWDDELLLNDERMAVETGVGRVVLPERLSADRETDPESERADKMLGLVADTLLPNSSTDLVDSGEKEEADVL